MSTKKQHKKFHFAIDEDLGKSFFNVLKACSFFDCDLFSDHWSPGTPDENWIPIAASKDLIVLSHDGRMRKQHRNRIITSGLRVIIIAGVTRPAEQAGYFVESWAQIERHIRKRGKGPYFSRFRGPSPMEIQSKLRPRGHIVAWDK